MAKLNEMLTAAYVWMTSRTENEEGQGLVEYALIIALVAIGLIVALMFLRGGVGNVFNGISSTLNTNV